MNTRKLKDSVLNYSVTVLSIIAILPLLLIFWFIFSRGISAINWQFLVELPKPVGEEAGGIANAIVGSFIILGVSTIMSIPLAILVAVYLTEFKTQKMARVVRLMVEVLQGIPSIVIGILAYLWVVRPMGNPSALSGSIALAIMMLPVMIRTCEETLRLLPSTLKEASLALGTPYHVTILKVILPAGMSGLVTGALLSIARVAGETAPLLFTAFGNPFMNVNIFKPIQSLPLTIFNYAISPYPQWHSLAWGASFILVVLILTLNLSTRFFTKKWKIMGS